MDIGIVSMRYAKAIMEYAKSTGRKTGCIGVADAVAQFQEAS